MATIPSTVKARLIKESRKFKKILLDAKDRDVNESDTVTIITDMLERVFGFDKYSEVTSEMSIKGSFCDLAVKLDGSIEYLIEVKAVGLNLKENHLRQVVNYGANHGIPWVVLTNGIEWQLYKVKFERPIGFDHLCTFDFTELNTRKSDDLGKLFLLCRSGMKKHAIEAFHDRVQSVNRFVMGAIISSDPVVRIIRRELRRMSPGLKIEEGEISKILKGEVLKREVVDGESASQAQARVKRAMGQMSRKRKKKAAAAPMTHSE